MQITLLIVINLTCECNSLLAILRIINKIRCQKKKYIESKHLIHAFAPLFFSSAVHEILVYISHSQQRDCICSLGLFMNLRCTLIESVLKYQIKFALFFIRIKKKFIRMRNVFFAFNLNEHYFVYSVPLLLFLLMGRFCVSLPLCMHCSRHDAAVCGMMCCILHTISD